MKISLNWLKDYVDTQLGIDELAELLTNTGLEVEGVEAFETVKGGLQGLVIGEVLEVWKHPDADKLQVTKVNIGEAEPLQIVCGAPNVAQGQKVIVATVGTTLYPSGHEPFKIKKAKIRGVESIGMICAEDEIGIGESHDGIIVLPGEAKAGTPAAAYYQLENDYTIEIGLTPNRSDAQSHLGAARDVVAAENVLNNAGLSLKRPDVSAFKAGSGTPITVTVEDTDACPRYSGITLENIKVQESPAWLQNKLRAVGVRPINNIVDITNFVLQEYGQPLHAFDADKIGGGQVIVKKLAEGTKFTTLDDEERSLKANDLMICDANGGMCIAGVFGGAGSGVTDNTTRIFLESAYFEPIGIRTTSYAHLLRTDAATHYEKGADPNITIEALKRAVLLMEELAGATVASEVIDVYPKPIQPKEVSIRYARVNMLIGEELSKEHVKNILQNLEIGIKEETEDGLLLSIPTYRPDVTREADVIEEIIRIHGLNSVPMPNQVRSSLQFGDAVDGQKLRFDTAKKLSGMGLREMMTNPVTRSAYYEKDAWKEKLVKLVNSQTAELDSLQASMLYTGLEVLAHNINRKIENIATFEFGKIYLKEGEGYTENQRLSFFLTGQQQEESWQGKQAPADYYQLKDIIEKTLAYLGIDGYTLAETTCGYLGYGMEFRKGEKVLAYFGKLKKSVLKPFDIKQEVYFGDIDWDIVLKQRRKHKITFQGLPKFPAMRRDLALVLAEEATFDKIEQIAQQEGKRLLKSINLFDVYRGQHIENGKKSYAVSFVFRDESKTLTDKEVDKIMARLIERYTTDLNAVIRQ